VQFVSYAREQVPPDLPTFLWGQSWGGGLSCLAAHDLHVWGKKLDGVVLTSPAIERPDELMLKIQAPFGNAIRAAAPAAKIVPGAPPRRMSSSSEEVSRYLQDPLNSPGNLPVETAQSTALGFDEIKKLKGGFVFPVLAIHGSLDKVLAPAATERLIEGVSSADKEFVKLEGFWHTCFHEPGWMDVFGLMEQWLAKRTGGVEGGGEGGGQQVEV
jgi:alpha-beta hydrolase superfamily lysophospholipase